MKKKVLFADLDGTLTQTITGEIFPQGIWDMQFRLEILRAIHYFGFECLVIVTNQGGIEKGYVDEKNFVKGKMEYVRRSLEEYLGIPVEYDYCPFNDEQNVFRKPNPGMLQAAYIRFIISRWHIDADKKDMLMIGDASGKVGQFSDTDKKTAENFGIDYMDVEDFYNAYFVETIQDEFNKGGNNDN